MRKKKPTSVQALTELSTEGPTDDEIEKARRRAAWDLGAMFDSAEELGGFYAGGLLFDRPETAREQQRALLAVTKDEIRDVARVIAQPERLNVLAVGILEDDEAKRLTGVVKSWQGAK